MIVATATVYGLELITLDKQLATGLDISGKTE